MASGQNGTGYLAVSINDTQVFNVSRTAYPLATGAFSGSFGFGAYQDQSAYFRNAAVHDTANGTSLYENALTSETVLTEYGTAELAASVCLDGPKRDRLVWLGDFYHTARILAASTSRVDHSRGTLQFLLDSQVANGQLNISPNLGYDIKASAAAMAAPSGSFGLPDYQILGLISFGDHVRLHNDVEWAKETWEGWQRNIDWLLATVNSTTGLITLPSPFAFIGGPDAGSPVSCAAVQALRGVADVATAIGDAESAERYTATASSLSDAINEKLWNDDIGAYSLTIYNATEISVPGTAFCITSSVASAGQTARSISALSALRLGPGYKDTSAVSSSDPAVKISPNTNGFLLPALFRGNATAGAGELLRGLWGAMIATNETDVGASWEYVNSATLAPGLGLLTSLCHPWGGAPTYVLTEWAAGLRPAAGVDGFGYKAWVPAPETGAQLGLKEASATVVTPFGDLSVDWRVEGQKVSATVHAPVDTSGSFVYGGQVVALSGNSTYQLSVDI
ncbi:alpha-l-rhamnosidase [Diaporthe eres]|uniref:Alpha-L-rhamnosidase n=1 Tax=Diaporthe vaccinii TaxID=105482 RepID=A0ABR4EBH0_9PEZI|nr:alpha-l-rhamnosidase [Diaporthe eres]